MATATKTKLPEFKGKPLIEIPSSIPSANFLEGDFGKAVHQEAKGIAKTDYNNAKALNIAQYQDSVVKGSNDFYVVLVNQVIRDQGLRTATTADLGKIVEVGALNLRGFYEDSALVLRSEKDPNEYLAKDLAKQVKQRKGKKFKYPVMINLKDLDLANDSDSPHGLAFKLREDAEPIYSQKLSHKNHQKSFSKTDNNGLPVFTKSGERTFYTIDSGLSWLYLDRDLDLGSDWGWGGLASSDSSGRVVIVSDKVGEKNFEEQITKLHQEKQKQIQEQTAKIEKNFKKAMTILKQ